MSRSSERATSVSSCPFIPARCDMLRFHTGWREFCATLGPGARNTDSDSFTDEGRRGRPQRAAGPQGYPHGIDHNFRPRRLPLGRRTECVPLPSLHNPRSPNMFGFSCASVPAWAASHGHVELHTVQAAQTKFAHTLRNWV